jgi:hypothetical protein
MIGPSIGKLFVYLKYENTTSLYWGFGENVGNIWNPAQLSIPKISDLKEFSFIFEGKINILQVKNKNFNNYYK